MNSLSNLFKPQSVAVIGASTKPMRAGNIVMQNLLQEGFDGAIMPVHPKYKSVCGVLAYPSVTDLPIVPDLVVLCTHASRNIEIFEQLAKIGAKLVVILSADMHVTSQNSDISIQQACLEIASAAGMRVIGPNSLGIILPWVNLNASFSPSSAHRGKIAFISQSAAVCTTVLDWANDKNIGFSAFVSLGNAIDIDFDELLDCFSTDRHTDAILLYVDTISDARRFMSAARAASRSRRILVLKAGRTHAGQLAAHAHTGGSNTLDIIYDSAIRRTGMLRVHNSHELFAAVETLTHSVPLRGERLAIITNGGGPAIMAVDTLISRGGKLATLDDALIEQLNQVLPDSWSHQNPIDMVGDASERRYINTINAIMDSDCADAILVMHSPSAIAHSDRTAKAVVDTVNKHPRRKRFNILTNWSGEMTARSARNIFTSAGIPTYRTPESSVVAFMHLVEYRRNQKQLMETPTTSEPVHTQDVESAKKWIKERLQGNESVSMDTQQIGGFLKYFDFNVLQTWLASDPSEAVLIAEQIGYPVAVKLRSPDIPHKSDVQGIMLNLRNAEEVSSASHAILDRTKVSYPAARIQGLGIQAMAKLAGGEEMRVKVITDETFGPVILIGQGGSEWDVSIDASAALPPLNTALARYLVVTAIKNGHIRPQKLPQPMDILGLAEFLVRVSQMVVDCPELYELDIHPLLVNGNQFTILDADLTLRPYQENKHPRLAIRPYPVDLEEFCTLKDGEQILLRPILPEDEPNHALFVQQVSKEDLYKRFFTDVGELNHEAMANLTQIDYDREMAFIAVSDAGKERQIIGVSRALINPDNTDAEFAILIRSDMKGRGLGKHLMNKILEYCRQKGTLQISGMTMPTNQGMLGLAKHLGFQVAVDFEDGTADMKMKL